MPHTHQIGRESRKPISLYMYRCTHEVPGAAWAPRKERFPSPASSHRKPVQATCWTLSGHLVPGGPKPAKRSEAPLVPDLSETDKFHVCLSPTTSPAPFLPNPSQYSSSLFSLIKLLSLS